VLVADVLILGYCGGSPADPFYVILAQVCSAYYFLHFLVILPWIARTERPVPLPNSITEAVLSGKGGTSPAETALAH
jgi:ubiquinol-cytochrome c reductase cytochrome b subunit